MQTPGVWTHGLVHVAAAINGGVSGAGQGHLVGGRGGEHLGQLVVGQVPSGVHLGGPSSFGPFVAY